jgi:hypothetical protein
MNDLSMDAKTVAIWSMPITLVLLAAVLVPHAVLYRESAFTVFFEEVGWWALPAFFAGIVVHELMHGVTMCAIGGLGWRDMTFGVNWKALMPYAHPRRPLPAYAYAIGAAMPGVVLGLAPAIVGLALGLGSWSAWGAIFLGAAAGDLMVIYSLRGVRPTALVQDHPSRVGCQLVTAAP